MIRNQILLFALLAILWPQFQLLAQPCQPKVDLEQIQGCWHEIARSPQFFQRGCVASTASYQLMPNGQIQVLNQCTTRSGHNKSIVGRAKSLSQPFNNQLVVGFDVPFGNRSFRRNKTNYQIFHVSENYSSMVVGTPGRRNFWVLSRDPNLNRNQRNQLIDIARREGFRTNRIIVRPSR